MSLRSTLINTIRPAAEKWRSYMTAPMISEIAKLAARQEPPAPQAAIEEAPAKPAAPQEPPTPTLAVAEEAPIADVSGPPKLKEIALGELDSLLSRAAASKDEQSRVAMLCEYVYKDASMTMPSDPFSPEYRDAVLRFYHRVTGRGTYNPASDELISFDPEERAKRPSIYTAGSSHFLGTFLEAFGQILQVANVAPGAKILEYGPGDGQMAIAFARMGCDVTVLDIEQRYLDAIERQADAIGVQIKTIQGEFSAEVGDGFDLILFFETFHHALNHFDLLRSLHGRVTPDGKIIFAGEPIIPAGDYWVDVAPFPWGVRMDALSLSAIRTYGWMELGFQESYFFEALARSGWKGAKVPSLSNGRGTCYVATH